MNAAERVAAEVDYIRSLDADQRVRYVAGLGYGEAGQLTRSAVAGWVVETELTELLERSPSATLTAWRTARRAVTDTPATIAARDRAASRRRLARGLNQFSKGIR